MFRGSKTSSPAQSLRRSSPRSRSSRYSRSAARSGARTPADSHSRKASGVGPISTRSPSSGVPSGRRPGSLGVGRPPPRGRRPGWIFGFGTEGVLIARPPRRRTGDGSVSRRRVVAAVARAAGHPHEVVGPGGEGRGDADLVRELEGEVQILAGGIEREVGVPCLPLRGSGRLRVRRRCCRPCRPPDAASRTMPDHAGERNLCRSGRGCGRGRPPGSAFLLRADGRPRASAANANGIRPAAAARGARGRARSRLRRGPRRSSG